MGSIYWCWFGKQQWKATFQEGSTVGRRNSTNLLSRYDVFPSSQLQLWLICVSATEPWCTPVFTAGFYWGKGKPASVSDPRNECISELNMMLRNNLKSASYLCGILSLPWSVVHPNGLLSDKWSDRRVFLAVAFEFRVDFKVISLLRSPTQ